MAKVVINKCFGGFGLSEAAYERMIELGVPVQKYIEQERDPITRLYKPEPRNDGEVIFDRNLDDPSEIGSAMRRLSGRYWDSWTDRNRSHPILVQVVEELGQCANGEHAKLKVVTIPDGVEFEISEYDGQEHIAEVHQTWA
jgi:hypothetical protein